MFKNFVNIFPETSTDTLKKIALYYELLLKWNRSHNLVQHETLKPELFETRHLIDCWQLVPYFDTTKVILDIGAGAGLPGILLAIAGFDVHLVEIDMNKVSFLKNCKALLELNCHILSTDIYTIDAKYEQVTSRAFSKLSTLLDIQLNVSRETKGVFLKGESWESEVELARAEWLFDCAAYDSRSSANGKIIAITNLRRIQPFYEEQN